MAHVVSQKCIAELYAACQGVCPVNAMHVTQLPAGFPSTGQSMMVIDPVVCTDCGLCRPECPIDAILPNADLDPYWSVINANLGPASTGAPWATPRPKKDAPRRPDNHLR